MAIATKKEEREALAKIKKMVEELGEGSYLAAAFKGCFEVAEENIANDWAGSLYDEVECLRDNLEIAGDSNLAIQKDRDEAEKAADLWKAKYENLDKMYKNSLESQKKGYETFCEVLNEREALDKENDALKAEIIDLKVRLCDLMLKEEKGE